MGRDAFFGPISEQIFFAFGCGCLLSFSTQHIGASDTELLPVWLGTALYSC